MNGRIDPPTTLGEEDGERIRDDGPTPCLGTEHHFAVGEGAEKDGRQESIFSEEEQVLLMKSVDFALTVLAHDVRMHDQWHPIVVGDLSRFEPVHGETSGETGHTTKDRLESLGEMMGDEVLVDLDHRHP